MFVMAAVGLLAIGPAHAQQAQGTDVTGSSSDVSGNLTQSDAYLFQTDEARVRMSDVAASLTEALRSGTLGESVVGGSPLSVSPEMTQLFVAGSRSDAKAASKPFVDALMIRGLSQTDATVLAQGVAGLLEGGTVTPDRFLNAIAAFNAAVDEAPVGFLAEPPHEFVVVRAVLKALLEGASA